MSGPSLESNRPAGAGFDVLGGVAIVTGAGTGVGRELARMLARAGASVVCCGRRIEPLQETVRLIEQGGGKALALLVDVTDRADVNRLVRRTLEQFDRIDLLVNNAGSFRAVGAVWEIDPEEWWRDVTINLKGAVLCAMAVLPHMREQRRGIVINLDGGGGACGPDIVMRRLGAKDAPRFNGPNLGGSGYGSSKAALMRFTEGLARELESDGSPVFVFGLNPGLVRTEMTEHLYATPLAARWQGHVAQLFEQHADRPPTDCAEAMMKLLRVASPELSGCVFDVDTDFEAVSRQRALVRERELYVMRLRDPRAGETPVHPGSGSRAGVSAAGVPTKAS